MIRIAGLSKSFGSVKALRQVGFEAAGGAIIALVGANGAGKTTLLRTLAGALVPDAGKIEYGGRPLDRSDMELRRRIFFLPDAPFLYASWTPPKHLAMIVQLYGLDPVGAEEEAVRLLKEFELLPLIDSPIQILSKGEAFKAALCGAFLSGAKVLLFDEPFASGIDPNGIMALKARLRQASDGGAVCLYSTQMLDVAERCCTHVMILNGGALEWFGTFEDLRSDVRAPSGRLEDLFRKLREEKR